MKIFALKFAYMGEDEEDDLPTRVTISASVEALSQVNLNFQTTVSAVNLET